jgi:hypothetical protein
MKKSLIILLFAGIFSGSYARKDVTIATFSVMPPRIPLSTDPEEVVQRMIAFWDDEISRVLPDHPDLIVLPEACDRPDGFSGHWNIEKRFYEVRGDRILHHFQKMAEDHHCYIVYSYKHKVADGSFRNTSVMIDRQGKVIGAYNKNYPTIGEMGRGVKAGKEPVIVETDFGRVGFLICFDLLFEDLRDAYARMKPDMLIFSARYHGGIMQSTWAYTTRSWFVSSVEDVPKLPSEVYSPLGERIAATTDYMDYVVTTINLDYDLVHLDQNWKKLEALKEKYGRDVTIHDPGFIGALLVTSNSKEKSVKDMLDEFDIKDWNDYYIRSVSYRNEHLNPEKKGKK